MCIQTHAPTLKHPARITINMRAKYACRLGCKFIALCECVMRFISISKRRRRRRILWVHWGWWLYMRIVLCAAERHMWCIYMCRFGCAGVNDVCDGNFIITHRERERRCACICDHLLYVWVCVFLCLSDNYEWTCVMRDRHPQAIVGIGMSVCVWIYATCITHVTIYIYMYMDWLIECSALYVWFSAQMNISIQSHPSTRVKRLQYPTRNTIFRATQKANTTHTHPHTHRNSLMSFRLGLGHTIVGSD